MKSALYQIDAFADKPFEGNPAAVVPLTQWLPDSVLQAIAQENNLAETAFYIPSADGYHIRWFTPTTEVELCGHATLASAYVLFNITGHSANSITFDSLSGPLVVTRQDDLLSLDFPAQPPKPCETPTALVEGLGLEPTACLRDQDYLAIFETEEDVYRLSPDFECLKDLDLRGVIVTAPGSGHDFIVRFFGPKVGIPEDAVTGSAYTHLTPYWANRLGQSFLRARQVSPRGGDVTCELRGDRVLISGRAVKYLEGVIEIEV